MVGGLVEEEDVGVPQGDETEDHAREQAVGHFVHGLELAVAGDAEGADLLAPLLHVESFQAPLGDDPVGEEVAEELVGGLLQVELVLRVLVVLADAQVAVAHHVALDGSDPAEHELEQRGLARAVWPHEGDARVEVDAEVEVLVEVVLLLARVAEAHVLEATDGRGQGVALGEAEPVDGVGRHLGREPRLHHLVNDLLLGLGLLAHVGVGAAGRDELLDVLDVRLLLLVALHLVGLVLLARAHEDLVVAAVVLELALVGEVHDVGADAVEEVLRVGDDQQALVVGGEVVLEPHAGAQVQVVGGLVQEQDGRGDEERLGEGHAHAPAARHVLCHLVHLRLREPEAVEQLAGALLKGGGVELLQLLVEKLEVGRIAALLLEDLLLEGFEALLLVSHHVNHRLDGRAVAGYRLRVEVPDVEVLGDVHHPRCQHREQSALPRAVEADQPVAAAIVELKDAVVEELLTVHRDGEVLDLHIPRVVAGCAHARHHARVQCPRSRGRPIPVGLLGPLLLAFDRLALDRVTRHRVRLGPALPGLRVALGRLATFRALLRLALRLLLCRESLLLLLGELLLKELLLALAHRCGAHVLRRLLGEHVRGGGVKLSIHGRLGGLRHLLLAPHVGGVSGDARATCPRGRLGGT
mmetsp:Transcript_2154/g.6231  ORF Transcript_2154/g.6231 Transcript_2154/m.6231 type:complete len:639 (-) Transcript_2154:12-1928(-)